ncbi:hypothetical protein ACS0TY_021569 [Phlomoides rotata]
MSVRTQFPLFAPPQLLPQPHRPATEIRFSRWNNANAQKFIRRERSQKEIEDQLRFEKRFDSAHTIAHNYNPAPPHPTTFKSTGTPSAPSSPSIPGKASKYSKGTAHPAFKPLPKPPKIPVDKIETQNPVSPNFRIDENGVSYEMPDAPFLFQYSYTETPKARPVKLREPLVSPFGPETMAKPWLGRKPLPPSKKRLPEFDSFRLPPPHKKGVKPVQAPGPFLPGSGPKYVRSREQVLGEPLSKEEIEELIRGSKKSSRQLNMGRDGLTHNMLDNIHALWKRRRVCKIKCKGVCTVDMDNVCKQLEERTGGKIIFNRGGVIYLFRGRNYNYKSRPHFPLMLWKPITPVYPRLVRKVPEGLTLEEANDMRKKGRDLIPICKLAKNGVYCDLVKNVREAFEACELVRINCQGLNPSDYKKIGAKLKDLVPCVLLSFEYEHILIWRGLDWKSSIKPTVSLNESQDVKTDGVTLGLSAASSSSVPNLSILEATFDDLGSTLTSTTGYEESPTASILTEFGADDIMSNESASSFVASHEATTEKILDESLRSSVSTSSCGNHPQLLDQTVESDAVLDGLVESQMTLENTESVAALLNNTSSSAEQMGLNEACTEGIMLLRNEAVENGMAVVLDDDSLDGDSVFKKAVAFGKTAPTGPVFRHHRPKQLGVEKGKEKDCDGSVWGVKEASSVVIVADTVSSGRDERKSRRRSKQMEDIKGDFLNVVPQGNLRVDELAKLLA